MQSDFNGFVLSREGNHGNFIHLFLDFPQKILEQLFIRDRKSDVLSEEVTFRKLVPSSSTVKFFVLRSLTDFFFI